MKLLSRSEELLLLAIYKLGNNAYGVTIRQQIHKDIGRYWSFGVIYKSLKKMKAKGYVKKTQSEPRSERGGRRRFYYHITEKGISVLKTIYLIHSSAWDGVRILSRGISMKNEK